MLLPAGDVVLNDSGSGYNFNTGVPNFKEFGYATADLAGDSVIFDGNGPRSASSRPVVRLRWAARSRTCARRCSAQ